MAPRHQLLIRFFFAFVPPCPSFFLSPCVVQPTDHSRGYTFEAESPIPYQQVSLLDPSTGSPVVGGIKRVKRQDGKGTDRYVKATGALIPKPVGSWSIRAPKITNPRTDTLAADVLAETYVKPDYSDKAKLVAPQVQKDAQGQPMTFREKIPLSHEERVRLLKKVQRSAQDQATLDAGYTEHTSTIIVPEDKELRAARIKF